MSEYFPKPEFLGQNVKVKLDISYYATKTDLKNATGLDTSGFAKSTDLANLKYHVHKLDIDKLKSVLSNLSNLKLETTLVYLSKLSDAVKNKAVKKLNIMLRSEILMIKYLILLT